MSWTRNLSTITLYVLCQTIKKNFQTKNCHREQCSIRGSLAGSRSDWQGQSWVLVMQMTRSGNYCKTALWLAEQKPWKVYKKYPKQLVQQLSVDNRKALLRATSDGTTNPPIPSPLIEKSCCSEKSMLIDGWSSINFNSMETAGSANKHAMRVFNAKQPMNHFHWFTT